MRPCGLILLTASMAGRGSYADGLVECIRLLLISKSGQDIDVLTVDGDLRGFVVKGVYGAQTLREGRQVGDLGFCELCRETLGEIVVESVEPLSRTLERLIDERLVSHGCGGNLWPASGDGARYIWDAGTVRTWRGRVPNR